VTNHSDKPVTDYHIDSQPLSLFLDIVSTIHWLISNGKFSDIYFITCCEELHENNASHD